jgi:hypothetical protein
MQQDSFKSIEIPKSNLCLLYLFVLLMGLYACGGSEEQKAQLEESKRPEDIGELPYNNYDSVFTNNQRLEDFKVGIITDKEIVEANKPFSLTVFIGNDTTSLEINPEGTSAWNTIPARYGLYASIEIKAFGVPISEKSDTKVKCIKLVKSGSSPSFSITPLDTGELRLRARIDLHQSSNCEDSPVIKNSPTSTVTVIVTKPSPLSELLQIAWEKFKEFWDALLVLLFGLILFLLRKKLKKWFGFEEKES